LLQGILRTTGGVQKIKFIMPWSHTKTRFVFNKHQAPSTVPNGIYFKEYIIILNIIAGPLLGGLAISVL
jgi:hypothetical protein